VGIPVGVESPGRVGGRRGASPRNTLRRNRLPPLARGHEIVAFAFDDPQKIRFRGETPLRPPTRPGAASWAHGAASARL